MHDLGVQIDENIAKSEAMGEFYPSEIVHIMIMII